MALIYHPGNDDVTENRRLMAMGGVVAGIGALILTAGAEFSLFFFRTPHSARLTGLVLIAVGGILLVTGFLGRRLQESWLERGFAVIPADHRDVPSDADAPVQAEADTAGKRSGIQRGASARVELRIEALKPIRLNRAFCRITVGRKRHATARRVRRIHSVRLEDVQYRGYRLEPGQTAVLRFTYHLPEGLPPSSDTCSWEAEVAIRAKGAPDYLQKHTFITY